MNLLSAYMMRTILATTALVLVVLLALAGLFEFIAQLDDIKGDYQTPQVILFTALRLPNLAFEMLPVAALIAVGGVEGMLAGLSRQGLPELMSLTGPRSGAMAIAFN